MKNKKLVATIAILVLVISVVGLSYAALTNFDPFDIGKKIVDAETEYGETVAAYVDDIPIYKVEVENARNAMNRLTRDSEASTEEALDHVIRRQVAYNEAVKMGFMVSIEEVDAITSSNLELLRASLDSSNQEERENAEQVYNSMLELIKGMGLPTIEAYNAEYLNPYMQLTMTTKALHDDFIKQYTVGSELTEDMVEEYYEEYLDGLVSRAKIVVTP